MNDELINIYMESREEVQQLLGATPEDYLISIFLDDDLYDSVLLQTAQGGTPHAILSSNELELLRTMKEKDLVVEKDLFYAGKNSKIYFSEKLLIADPLVIKAKFVQALALATLCEHTVSKFPRVLQDVFRYDAIIKELFANNVFELVKERNAAWAWQYFLDFVATLKLLAVYDLADFYVPPTAMREASVFYNFLLEVKGIVQKRAKSERRAPLWDLTLYGFGHYVLRQYLATLTKKEKERVLPHLKANLGQPFGEIGAEFLQWHTELEENEGKSILTIAAAFESDFDLVKHWSRSQTKRRLEIARERIGDSSIVWHAYKDGYWSDLWPLRANAYDKAAAYVGKIQRRKYSSHVDFLNDKSSVISHGRVQLPDREVAVFSIQEDTVGQEQLLLLRNHLIARKDTFLTPLPGLPDVIVFRKYAGMHVASFIGVRKSFNYPKSPYDLPLVTRAIQVSKKRDAYKSEERDAEGKLAETVDYSDLTQLSEPQHRAVRYLIRQLEVTQ